MLSGFRQDAFDLRRVAAVGPLLPAGLLFVLLLIWIAASGGYFPETWYPSTIAVLGLLGATLSAGLGPLPSRRPARIALLAFTTLVGLNYLSMLWSDSPVSAWQASNKLLLYLAAAWTISILPWTPRALFWLLTAWVLAVAVMCAVALIGAVSTSHLARYFVEFRYAEPMQYPNATAGLAAMAMWPALIFSARRELPIWLQALFLAAAVFLADLTLLPQSRAAPVGMALVAPLALALVSDRVRFLPRAAVAGGSLALVLPRTLRVDKAVGSAPHHVSPSLHAAATMMLTCAVGATLIGLVLGFGEHRLADAFAAWRAGRRSRRAAPAPYQVRRAALVAGPVAVLITVVLVVVFAGGAIGHAARTEWRRVGGDSSSAPRLLTTTPEQRFEYIRVGWKLFKGSPIGGVGAGNFGIRYDALRHDPKHSQYTHNLGLRALTETGILGFALLVVVVAALAVAAFRAARVHPGLGRACAVSALAVAAYFLVHDTLDWMDEFPSLAVPALAWPLAASAMRGGESPDRQPFRAVLPSGRRIAVIAAVIGIAVLTLIPPYLATRFIRRAYATYRVRPDGAYDDLRRAAALNPLSIEPLTGKGTIAIYRRQPDVARAAFTAALKRENNWYPRLELALLDAQAGQFATALQTLNGAQALDHDDPLLDEAREMIVQHKRIDPVRFNALGVTGPQAPFFNQERLT